MEEYSHSDSYELRYISTNQLRIGLPSSNKPAAPLAAVFQGVSDLQNAHPVHHMQNALKM